jgi:hypothetical protein
VGGGERQGEENTQGEGAGKLKFHGEQFSLLGFQQQQE